MEGEDEKTERLPVKRFEFVSFSMFLCFPCIQIKYMKHVLTKMVLILNLK